MDIKRIAVATEVIRGALSSLDAEERVEVLARVSGPADVGEALRVAGGNVSTAARALGVSRRTVQVRMRELGMAPGRPGRPHKLAGRKL